MTTVGELIEWLQAPHPLTPVTLIADGHEGDEGEPITVEYNEDGDGVVIIEQ